MIKYSKWYVVKHERGQHTWYEVHRTITLLGFIKREQHLNYSSGSIIRTTIGTAKAYCSDANSKEEPIIKTKILSNEE